jgi:hypothetical protein
MLVPYTFPQGVDFMQRNKRGQNAVDWDALELQVFNLRFESMSPEDTMRKAQRLASTFRRHNEPLPDRLEILVQREAGAPRPSRRSSRLPRSVSAC